MIVEYMKNKFEISAKFGEIDGVKCRSVLRINALEKGGDKLRFLTVMMNPGGSKPNSEIVTSTEYCSAVPDRTQYQIINLMIRVGIKCMDVINLIDIREPKSGKLIEYLKGENYMKYSIFSEERGVELDRMLKSSDIIICAWGVNKNLRNIANIAIDRMKGKILVGLKKDDDECLYYHPLPRRNKAKWVDAMERELLMHVN